MFWAWDRKLNDMYKDSNVVYFLDADRSLVNLGDGDYKCGDG